jgi:predicted dehydrogenase
MAETDEQDQLHAEAVSAFSSLGYHIMCEKPMATSIKDCVDMLRDVTSESMKGKVFAIGHVMRYSPYNVAIREVIDSGVLGDIVDVQVSRPARP